VSNPDNSQNHAGPFDLSISPIHLGNAVPDQNTSVPQVNFGFDGPAFEAYIKAHCNTDPGRLIMVESTPQDWSSWERHTQGDEIVIVLEGRGEFIQDIDGNEVRIPVQAGSTIINGSGVWHTADVVEPIRAIYITPCPGTEHKPR